VDHVESLEMLIITGAMSIRLMRWNVYAIAAKRITAVIIAEKPLKIINTARSRINTIARDVYND